MTYKGHWKSNGTGFNTPGIYSAHLVVKEGFVLNIPVNLELSAVAPILRNGVTAYSPPKH